MMTQSPEKPQHANTDGSQFLVNQLQIKNKLKCLPWGSLIEVQFLLRKAERCYMELVGMVSGSHMILRFCGKSPVPNFKVESGMAVACRLIMEDGFGECMGFRSQVLTVVSQPSKLVFVKFPERLEHKPLRSHMRAPMDLMAKLCLGEKSIENNQWQTYGYIKDISLGGCRFQFSVEGRNIKVNNVDVVLCVDLPNVDKQFELNGLVQNSKVRQSEISLGIEFATDKNKIQQVLSQIAPTAIQNVS